jgi:UMF1 family MFS transporter
MQKLKLTKEKTGWIFFDFADSSFVTIIVTVLFSMYFKNIVVGKEEYGTVLWSVATSISLLFVVLLAPIMGAIADFSHSRKLLLVVSACVTIFFTALLFFVKEGDIYLAMLFFIVAFVPYNMCKVFHNSFLSDIAEKHEIGRISGISWGIGYLGGLIALLLVMPIVKLDLVNHLNYRFSFVVVALFFLVFALPTFILLKERQRPRIQRENYIIEGYNRILHTARNVRKYKELVKFLISYFFYNNGISVVIFFAAIYGSTRFNMSAMEMLFYFVLAQPSSFVGALIFGYILDKIGAKKSINYTLILWMFVILGAFFCASKSQFYIVGICAGFVIGCSQANSRTMFATLTPQEKSSEYFGFYGVTDALASIAAPLAYGLIAYLTGDQRYSILSVLVFFVLGFIMLQFVKE